MAGREQAGAQRRPLHTLAVVQRASSFRARLCLMSSCVVIVLLAMTGAAYAEYPSATVSPPSPVGETTATLRGDVNPHGMETRYTFNVYTTIPGESVQCKTVSQQFGELLAIEEEVAKYGKSSETLKQEEEATSRLLAFEASIKWEMWITNPIEGNAGSGTRSIEVAQSMTGLLSGTKYCYSITADHGYLTEPEIPEEEPTWEPNEVVTSAFEPLTTGGTPPPPPPPPPTVSTGTASDLAPTKAKLGGSVDPNGVDIHYWFEYGTTTEYEYNTDMYDAGSGTTNVPVNLPIQRLKPGTVYYFRIAASNADEPPIYGEGHQFKTLGPVEAVTTTATSLTEAQATLNGTVNPNGYLAQYYFEYGETTAYGHKSSTGIAPRSESPEPASMTIHGLRPDMGYHYRLVANSGNGVLSYGHDRAFITAAWSAAVAESGDEGINVCVGGTSAPTGCTRGPGAEAANTSPSVTYLGDGSAAESFVGANKHLDECHLNPVSYFGGSNCYESSLKVTASTSPGSAEIAGGSAIVAVNAGGKLSFCDATPTGPVNCANSNWSVLAGASPSVAPLSDGSAAVGFVGTNNHLDQCRVTSSGGSNCYETSTVVASGTNPSVAEITGGSAIMAVNTGSGLSFCDATSSGPVNCANSGWVVLAGTNPSVAPLSDGSAAIGFVGSTGHLDQCRVTSSGGSNCYETSTVVSSGTSPSVAEITGGSAIMAVNTASGLSFCDATSTGPVNCASAGWVVLAGSSPSVAPLSDGSAAVGFVGSTGHLDQCRVTSSGGSNCYETSTVVSSGTNPSVAEITSGSAIMAVNAGSGLSECTATTSGPAECTIGSSIATGASLNEAPLSDGSAAVSFSGNGRHLDQCRVTSFGGSNCYESSLKVASGTNPSSAEITGGSAIVAVNTGSKLSFCDATPTGPVNCASSNWNMLTGTNPSVAPLSDGSAAVGFVGTNNHLDQCRVTSSGGSNCYETSTVVTSGTNPSVAEITGGSAIMAVNTASGLSFCDATPTGPVNCASAGWVVLAGSSPGVAPLSDGSAAVGFVGSTGHLDQCRITSSGGSNCYETSTVVTSGTNPSIAWLPGGEMG